MLRVRLRWHLGLPGDNTYANYQEANRAFYRQAVLPLATKIGGSVARWLSEFESEKLDIFADLDGIPALSSEREAQWKRVSEAEFLSNAEKREMLGLSNVSDQL